jgi:hypothetical protein
MVGGVCYLWLLWIKTFEGIVDGCEKNGYLE